MADEVQTDVTLPEDPGVTVEVVPDEEAHGRGLGKPQLSDEEVEKLAELPGDDEISRYAKDAQKRIKAQHLVNQEWRRRAIQSNKDVATAANLAEQLYRENQQLKQTAQRSENALVEQALQRSEAQLAQAKARHKAAYTAGDADQVVLAQEEVARCVAECHNLRLLRPAPGEVATPASTAAAAPQAAAPPPMSPATETWVKKNPWWRQPGEEERTGFALAVHHSLAQQGISEVSNPELYWGTIDRRLREVYPQHYSTKEDKTTTGTRPVNVAGGMRTNGGSPASQRGPRHVTLTESEVRIAKQLGITNEQYATQLVKEQQKRERPS
ncbi:MAG TPA: hypothetical protein VI455_02185 [Terriglobia bacterium]